MIQVHHHVHDRSYVTSSFLLRLRLQDYDLVFLAAPQTGPGDIQITPALPSQIARFETGSQKGALDHQLTYDFFICFSGLPLTSPISDWDSRILAPKMRISHLVSPRMEVSRAKRG